MSNLESQYLEEAERIYSLTSCPGDPSFWSLDDKVQKYYINEAKATRDFEDEEW